MSIQSEINRISGNVSDALDAIEDKGVTIPSGANSDDLADLIAQITGGGGGSVYIRDTTDSHGGTIREIMSEDEITVDSLSVTQNGTYTAPSGTVYNEVTVDVSGGGGSEDPVKVTIVGSGYPQYGKVFYMTARTGGLPPITYQGTFNTVPSASTVVYLPVTRGGKGLLSVWCNQQYYSIYCSGATSLGGTSQARMYECEANSTVTIYVEYNS